MSCDNMITTAISNIGMQFMLPDLSVFFSVKHPSHSPPVLPDLSVFFSVKHPSHSPPVLALLSADPSGQLCGDWTLLFAFFRFSVNDRTLKL